MKFLRGLSGIVALWLLAVFLVAAFVGWDQLKDIADIHARALQIESVNHKSHALHELEIAVRAQESHVHDFLITGSEQHAQAFRSGVPMLRRSISKISALGINTAKLLHMVERINIIAEQVFSLPFATGNMEGPILMHDLDNQIAALIRQLAREHHNMDNEVNESMRFVTSLHLDMRGDFIASLVVLFALLSGLTIYIYLRVFRPLSILRGRVATIGEGGSLEDVESPDFGDNEIGELSTALNRMNRAIHQHQQELIHARSLQAHQEKMQALGLMTANIAHEVGNPLSAASVSLDVAQHQLNAGRYDESKRHLRHVSEELQRTENIIQNILNFGRPSQTTIDTVDIHAVVNSAMQLVTLARKPRHVSIQYRPAEYTPPVSGSEDMLRQVLVNLLINAIDASPDGATVTIVGQVNNDGMVLDITDQGCGIDAAHVEAIFSPMFSTKQLGEGTGLGLSISRDLMQQMGGDLLLWSNNSEGCTFRMHLPHKIGGDDADSGD